MIATHYKLNTVPTTTDDLAHNYFVGDTWRNETATAYDLYICKSNTNNNAIWEVSNNVVKTQSSIITYETLNDGINSNYVPTNTFSDGLAIKAVNETYLTPDIGVNSSFVPNNSFSNGLAIFNFMLTYSSSAAAQFIKVKK